MRKENESTLGYSLGGLLYMPAFQGNIVPKIAQRLIPHLRSLAFCLEDSIRDNAVSAAESALKGTLAALAASHIPPADMPLIFIRVRSPQQMAHLHADYHESHAVITGYILPKFDASNADEYRRAIEAINRHSPRPVYVMPILESKPIAYKPTRLAALAEIRAVLDSIKPYVLNVRVGGNDLCNLYGLRRPIDKTIYDIGVVRDILMDIINMFVPDYIVSGPAWNYFGDDQGGDWACGLVRELGLDRQNGFIGKTAIHPRQLGLINRSLAVSREDYDDACAIMGWQHETSGVAKSVQGRRMNEVKCHTNWAERTKILGDIYGIREAT